MLGQIEPAVVTGPTLGRRVGDILGNMFTGALEVVSNAAVTELSQSLQTELPPEAYPPEVRERLAQQARPKAPTWTYMIPLGIAGAAAAAAVVLTIKKRRK